MATHAKENYLKAFFHLHQKSEEISLVELSRHMEVSAPTANNMVKRLKAQGWVIYKKYKPLRLSPSGKKIAGRIIRKHRLTEMFLSQVMGFGWEEVHDIAEEMEHLSVEKFFDRMDELLGFPTVDPHGSPIPNKDGIVVTPTYQRLSETPKGKEVRVCALKNNSSEFMVFLNQKDIRLGTRITIHNIEPFDKSYTVSYEHHPNEVLSNAVCLGLLVESV